MKKVIYIFIALFLLSCGSNKTASISTETTAEISSPVVTVQSILSNMENESYKEGELLVKFKSGVSASVSIMTHQAAGVSVKKTFNLVPNLEHVKLPQNMSVRDAIVQYMSDPNVEYAEPNYIRHAFSTIPNDTYFDQQWALNNTGLYANGTPGADIQASDAWDITRGSGSITIAVADTGIDYNHPELVGNIWKNTLETSCTDGIDNDMNGYIDDCIGWDFFNIDNDPIDDHGHGTHVAGTIGAVGNNGEGVSGVMWNIQLMPLKFLDSDGLGTTADAILAIEYAVANGARIINASYGGSMFSQSEYDTINSANSAGVLLIAAAGNNGANNDLTPAYPASHNLPNIISVTATDQNDSRATFSNFGPVSVDVAAPGVYILNTVPPGLTFSLCTGTFSAGYDFCSGTSMSAPHVSGLAGLLYS
ncbi:MAG: S8 family serine peptidase, partial [Candidatus Mariimomonas ferrooxydans]